MKKIKRKVSKTRSYKKSKKKTTKKRRNPVQTYTNGALYGFPKILAGKWYIVENPRQEPIVVRLEKYEDRLLGRKWTAVTLDNKPILIYEDYLIEGPFETPSAAIKYLK